MVERRRTQRVFNGYLLPILQSERDSINPEMVQY